MSFGSQEPELVGDQRVRIASLSLMRAGRESCIVERRLYVVAKVRNGSLAPLNDRYKRTALDHEGSVRGAIRDIREAGCQRITSSPRSTIDSDMR